MEDKNSIQENYKVLIDTIKESEEQLNMYRDILKNSYENDQMSFGRAKFLFDAYTKDEIKKMDNDIAEEALIKIRIPDKPLENTDELAETQLVKDWVKMILQQYYENKNVKDQVIDTEESEETETENDFEKVYEESKYDLIREVLMSLKDDFIALEESEKDVEELKSQMNSVVKEYHNYMCSPEYEEKRKKNIETLEKRIQELKENGKSYDHHEVAQMSKKIETMKNIINGSFILNRLKVNGKSEVSSIVKSYFDNKKSSYIIDRFKDKIIKVGFNKDTYRFFFNIEEKYLPEEYHVYNNLFLFIVMRFIAYININSEDDRSYVRSIVSSISKLIYEKYTEEYKEQFINTIKECLDYFEDYRDKFDKDNILHPNHPKRIEREKAKETEERNIFLKTLELNGYEITDELRNLPFDEFKTKCTEILDTMEKEKRNDAIGDISEFINKTKASNTEEIKKEETESTDDSCCNHCSPVECCNHCSPVE